MLTKYNKNLEIILDKVDIYNTHFYNHVGQHKEEYIRRGITILQIVLLVSVLFI